MSKNHLKEGKVCLSNWITRLLTAVPIRSRTTFVELLCGCLISSEGWVTRAIRNMPVIEVKLKPYGKEQLVCLHAVWCEFYDADKQRWWNENNLWQQKRTVLELRKTLSLSMLGTMARQTTTTDRRSGGTVATHGIYRACFQGLFQPEVLDIHLPKHRGDARIWAACLKLRLFNKTRSI